ncbi:hypothetical protein MCC93_12690 [Morococcus cerebrosus]|uniref:Uncharacterized protein n=1 Tax=Morococcus cerebrosus TaxID=1056807 RepID=A0A0C1E7I9_9NEIS|nr:hypothetical protein MCC93_12690 [Morococcus cerebrosus]
MFYPLRKIKHCLSRKIKYIQTTGIYLLRNECHYTKGRLKISDDLL